MYCKPNVNGIVDTLGVKRRLIYAVFTQTSRVTHGMLEIPS